MIYVSNITSRQRPLPMPSMVVNRVSRVRVQQLEGRDHYVVPVVMLTVGVHNGSNGGLLYRAERLEQTAPRWNGKPIVMYHPSLSQSAASPEVFTKSRVGTVFNSRFDGTKLRGEAWIDVERIEKLHRQTAHAIVAGQSIEVSTGLFTNPTGLQGTHNGKAYSAVANDIVPDHLALLPGKIGACSVADGCGMGATMNERTNTLSLPSLSGAFPLERG